METNFPSRMFYGICFPWIQNEATAVLEQVATSPCWMEAHLVTSGAGSKTSAKEAAWLGAVHPSEWAGDTISLGFFEERAVLQPSSMNWSFRKPRPEFERIWASRWVLVKTKSGFDPKPAKLSDFEHLSRIQWSQEVRDGEDNRNSVLVHKSHLNPKVQIKS